MTLSISSETETPLYKKPFSLKEAFSDRNKLEQYLFSPFNQAFYSLSKLAERSDVRYIVSKEVEATLAEVAKTGIFSKTAYFDFYGSTDEEFSGVWAYFDIKDEQTDFLTVGIFLSRHKIQISYQFLGLDHKQSFATRTYSSGNPQGTHFYLQKDQKDLKTFIEGLAFQIDTEFSF